MHAGTAAIRSDGTAHPEQVSLTELSEGQFGNLVVEMVEYIAERYPVDAIDLTEAAYRETSFGPADLASFKTFTGSSEWPRDWRGRVKSDAPRIWEWKSALMEKFVARAAAAAHRHGKLLYLDVAASWADLRRDGKDHGHDYARLLPLVDQLVVWNYFALQNLPPGVSRDLAARLSATLPPGKWTLSIGLWGPAGKPVSAEDLSTALAASIEGGARRIWITPDDQVTDAHWNAILRAWLLPVKGAPPPVTGAALPRGR
jgi:hypothetical protein